MSISIDRTLAQQIVDAVQGVCGQHVNFIRPDGIILASTHADRIGVLHEAGLMAAREQTVQEVCRTEGGSRPGINLPILHNGQVIAVIGITGQPGEVRRYAQLAERITLLLVREQQLSDYSRTQADKRRYVMDALRSPEKADANYLMDLLRGFDVDPGTLKRIVLLRLEPEERQTLSGLESTATALCRNLGAALYYYYYPDTLVAVLEDANLSQVGPALKRFAAAQRGQCKIGVGKRAPLGGLAESWTTAQTACHSATRRKNNYALFDDLTWELVLADLPSDTRTALLRKTLAPLDEDDCRLLRVYFSQNLSLQKTADELHLHKNTLQYHLNRIRKRCSLNPRNFYDGALLYLALQAEEMCR